MAGVELLNLGGKGSQGFQPVEPATDSQAWLYSAHILPGHWPLRWLLPGTKEPMVGGCIWTERPLSLVWRCGLPLLPLPSVRQQMLGGARGPGFPSAQLRARGEPDVTYQPQRRDRIQLCGGRNGKGPLPSQ